MAKPKAFTARWPISLSPSYGPYRAVLDRWMDADTGLFLVDVGFGCYEHVEIRVAGYNAPEPHTDAGKAAVEFANRLAPPGSRVLLHETAKGFSPTFTRYTSQIMLEHGPDYGASLWAAGHAEIVDQ